MVRHKGGRWDVGTKNNAVYLERISEGDERLFDDLLAAGEARELAGLLTKYADKLDESGGSDVADDSEDSDEPGDSDKSDANNNSEDSEDSDKSSDCGPTSKRRHVRSS
jgi:hypothetical protein